MSGSLDTSIRVWNVETGQCIHTLTGKLLKDASSALRMLWC